MSERGTTISDNVAITAGSGTTIAADEVSDGTLGSVKVQYVKIMDGTIDGTSKLLVGANGLAADIKASVQITTGLKQTNISQTPTVSTSPAYTAGDALGGLLTFANAADTSGGSGLIQAVTVLCKTAALVPVIDLYLFNQTFTNTADNSPFAPSDGDMANCIGVIPIAAWAAETASSVNSIATRFGLGFPFLLTGTSLFGQMVTRTAFTAGGTTDFVIGLQIIQD